MRRKDREKSAEFAADVLKKSEYMSLATVDAEGNPYVVPISGVYLDGSIYFHCAKEGRKNSNIKADNRVSLCAVSETRLIPEKFTAEYKSAVVEGICDVVTEVEEKRTVLMNICKKFAMGNEAGFESGVARSIDKTEVFRIKIDAISGKGRP